MAKVSGQPAVRDMAGRVAAVRERIAVAALRAGRPVEDITLVAISKGHAASDVRQVFAAGVWHFGENRVQEAVEKISAAREERLDAVWHLVGHLQRNKVGAALGLFDIIDSLDSLRLAEAIDAQADARVRVLLEVNVANEPTKFGTRPADVPELVERLGALRRIELVGLMTVAPPVDDPEAVRPVFRALRRLGVSLGLRELSMGMTDDFEVAIEEGSTQVRVGRAIFGPRSE